MDEVISNRDDNVSKWISALRSEQFDQGFGSRHAVENGVHCYCPFGVAGVVLTGNANTVVDRLGFGEQVRPFDRCQAIGESGKLSRDFVSKILTLNDDERLSFPAIADEIERNRQKWFE